MNKQSTVYPPYGGTLDEWFAEECAADPTYPARANESYRAFCLGCDLALLREDRGLSQRQLADASGVRQPHLSRIEKGTLPTIPVLQRLLKALRATMFTDEQGFIRLNPADLPEWKNEPRTLLPEPAPESREALAA